MAMELWVLSDIKLNSITEWQSAIDASGLPLRLSGQIAFQKLNGFLPAQLGRQQTGFECNHWPADQLIHDFPKVDFGHEWKFALACRWRGDFNELRAAWVAGAAYAQATNGILFDDQEGKIRSAEEAGEVARREYEAPDPDIKSMTDQILRDLKLGPYSEHSE